MKSLAKRVPSVPLSGAEGVSFCAFEGVLFLPEQVTPRFSFSTAAPSSAALLVAEAGKQRECLQLRQTSDFVT